VVAKFGHDGNVIVGIGRDHNFTFGHFVLRAIVACSINGMDNLLRQNVGTYSHTIVPRYRGLSIFEWKEERLKASEKNFFIVLVREPFLNFVVVTKFRN
jgi:hypothetical protein